VTDAAALLEVEGEAEVVVVAAAAVEAGEEELLETLEDDEELVLETVELVMPDALEEVLAALEDDELAEELDAEEALLLLLAPAAGTTCPPVTPTLGIVPPLEDLAALCTVVKSLQLMQPTMPPVQ